MVVKLPKDVFDGIMAIKDRKSCNFGDYGAVTAEADADGAAETAKWLRANHKLYAQGLTEGYVCDDDPATDDCSEGSDKADSDKADAVGSDGDTVTEEVSAAESVDAGAATEEGTETEERHTIAEGASDVSSDAAGADESSGSIESGTIPPQA